MQITALQKGHLPEAAALFVENFKHLRQVVPEVPGLMENEANVIQKLERLQNASSGLAVLDQGRLVGYMGWFYVDDFRDTGRRAAYCPEWAHAVARGLQSEIYRALYRSAAGQWAAEGCQVHALALLANDPVTEKVWFWNGFGLAVVDAIRTTRPLSISARANFTIRKASEEDAESISALDAEHWRHYASSPIFMVPQPSKDVSETEAFLAVPKNTIWLALQDDEPAGFIQFESQGFGAASVVSTEDSIAITGAYVRPEYRGRKLAAAILDAALRDYSDLGVERCSVDFESFNPEAAGFWMKFFKPVCFSLMRVPENSA